ncbi:hypothetical protein [Amaricoccus tamworthensis]|uniref:hypothetical protein n=1 Tax=Amaricoccus tamworthensis TaxID=57002 RepID=UPI003C798565
MSIFGTFAKFGVPALVGFLIGLVAIAIIQPVTLNGKILLVATVICFVVVFARVLAVVLALIRPAPPQKPEDRPKG